MIDNREFYRNHAQEFFAQTAYENVEKLYAQFLSRRPDGAHILDAGRGAMHALRTTASGG